jgi:hypothetical protein
MRRSQDDVGRFRRYNTLKLLGLDSANEGFMRVTTVEGTVENGQIRLPVDVRLPENAKVYVVVPGVEEGATFYMASPRLARPEQAADFEKEVLEESPDAGL